MGKQGNGGTGEWGNREMGEQGNGGTGKWGNRGKGNRNWLVDSYYFLFSPFPRYPLPLFPHFPVLPLPFTLYPLPFPPCKLPPNKSSRVRMPPRKRSRALTNLRISLPIR